MPQLSSLTESRGAVCLAQLAIRRRGTRVRIGVKGGKVQTEQMFTGLHLKADARRSREKNRSHPAMDR